MDDSAEKKDRKSKPRNSRWSGIWKKAETHWARYSLTIAVLGSAVAGYNWIDNKLDRIQQSAVDITQLKESNQAILDAHNATNQRFSEYVNRAQDQIAEEFRKRDEADVARDARSTAILNEVRARHGVVTLADSAQPRSRVVRRAQEASDEASSSALSAVPEDDPLSGLDAL